MINSTRMSRHSLTKKVGHGSNRQDLVGDFIIAFWISSSETSLKESKLGRSEGAGKLKESVLENESLMGQTTKCIHSFGKSLNVYIQWLCCEMYKFNGLNF